MMGEHLSLFEVRLAEESDINSIIEITREAFLKYSKMIGVSKLDALSETYDDVKYDIENKIVLIALSDGEPVGCVRVQVKPDGTAVLTRFAVKVTCQNNGIGKSMMNHVDKLMKKHSVKKISLYTASRSASLIRFYYGRGFYIESVDSTRGYLRARLVKEY